MTKVAIIGAGIGGLTAALALHSREIDVSIYERSRQMEASGAGIQLSCNPNHVLTDLSVLDAALGVAFEPEALNVVDGHTGSILLSVRLGGWARQRYGAPYLNIHSGDLQQVLLDAVQQRIPGALELGKRVIGVSQDVHSVSVMFAEGQEIDADIVVGADGVHSVLRETVTSVEPARFTGHVAYRMLIPRSEMPTRSIPPPVVTMRLGRHGHVVGYWVTGGDVYNVVAVAEDDRWHEENWRTPAELDEVRSAFRAWDSQLRTLIDNARDVYKWALLDHSVPEQWTRGRVALLGDSCHAMLPYLAQGGAMAIEDAWVLAASLAASAEPTEGLRRYSQQRLQRVRRVHTGATRNARLFHLSGPRRVARNISLWLLGRRPQDFISRMDWLYGHNVTAAPPV